jgi:hypothetical protein
MAADRLAPIRPHPRHFKLNIVRPAAGAAQIDIGE